MEPKDILLEATRIARGAKNEAERADLELAVRKAENSDVPVLRSLARTYRMLQRPPY